MAIPIKDIVIESDAPDQLFLDLHINYIKNYSTNTDSYEYRMSEYLRMSGIYWATTALHLMTTSDLNCDNQAEILDFIRKCQNSDGGFSAMMKHDSHLLYTLSAIQICVIFDRVDIIDIDAVVNYISLRQCRNTGHFTGDKYGEIDTRFTFCAVMALSLLNRMEVIDTKLAIDYILSCMNKDGGFGTRTGSESHAGQVYCCVGTLSILNSLDCIDIDALGYWLCERQLPSGGLNGRPEKLPDVCYSWWVLASLSIIGRLRWIDKSRLRKYILASQDEETGGFADRPGDCVDPFHTLFGIAGLSLLGDSTIQSVHPVYCLPIIVVKRLGLVTQIIDTKQNT